MKTLVVKIGTSTLVRAQAIDEAYLADLGRQVAQLTAQNWRVVLVTSGAVRVGLNLIGRERAATLVEKQAAAAMGQSLVMRAYRRALTPQNLHVAQMLLTRADISDRRRYLNSRNTMRQLFSWGVIPVVNENDTVATEEIRVGDNDTLAALTALVAEADIVLLLSDIDGFYLPGQDKPEAVIASITPQIENAAGGAGTVSGTGGMRTKIEAARIATQAGIEFVIAHGRATDVVTRVANGEELGTRFLPTGRLKGRKRWLAYGRRAEGRVRLNPGARPHLLERGSSLLPIGIVSVEGEFDARSLVIIEDELGEIGRGLSNFTSTELRKIAGRHSSEIALILEREAGPEAVHRDDLSLNTELLPKNSELL